jgi:hypothetical protein
VIQNRDIQIGTGLLDLLGDLQVNFEWLQVAGGMVMNNFQ